MDEIIWYAIKYDDDPLWLVADENDNPVAEDLIKEHADMIAQAPALLKALEQVVGDKGLMSPETLMEYSALIKKAKGG